MRNVIKIISGWLADYKWNKHHKAFLRLQSEIRKDPVLAYQWRQSIQDGMAARANARRPSPHGESVITAMCSAEEEVEAKAIMWNLFQVTGDDLKLPYPVGTIEQMSEKFKE